MDGIHQSHPHNLVTQNRLSKSRHSLEVGLNSGNSRVPQNKLWNSSLPFARLLTSLTLTEIILKMGLRIIPTP